MKAGSAHVRIKTGVPRWKEKVNLYNFFFCFFLLLRSLESLSAFRGHYFLNFVLESCSSGCFDDEPDPLVFYHVHHFEYDGVGRNM